MTWSIKGLSLYKLGEYEEAIEAYNRVLSIDPNDKNIWLLKGDALYSSGEYNKSIEAYDKALDIDPSFTNATESKELALKRMAGQINAQRHEQERWSLFWKSITVGALSLSYLEVWIAGVLYGVMMIVFLLAVLRLFRKEIGFRESFFYMVGGTIFQGICMSFVISNLQKICVTFIRCAVNNMTSCFTCDHFQIMSYLI